ncbi:MAG TPA: SO2930 family diheme c-type cytochrome [Terriglobia bacterium]|nr:SO2930 family diheme c-type cytochrome [Terriglobia bacterium]
MEIGKAQHHRDGRKHAAPNPTAPRHNLAVMSFLFLVAAGVVVMVYRRSHAGVQPHLQEPFPAKLSAWRLFVGRAADLHPNNAVVPYDINTPLFSDYALKHRFVWMPPGTSVKYRPHDVFDFPVGTIFSKTFAFPVEGHHGERLIETRLLVRTAARWVGLPYVWNQAQTEATLDIDADPVPVEFIDDGGRVHQTNYNIPNANQCKECHELKKTMEPLGPNARNLNKTYFYAKGPANQLEHWKEIGYLADAPTSAQAPRAAVWNDPSTGDLDARARSYLDINCGTCHRPGAAAATSALYLNLAENDAEHLGVCKAPVSAGRGSGNLLFDIVPGEPQESIIVHRMDSTEPKVMMPEIGRTLTHAEGVDLIRQWISTLPGTCAPALPAGHRGASS